MACTACRPVATNGHGARLFNQRISSWDVSSVMDMTGMFGGARSFTGVGLGEWVRGPFEDETIVFQPDVSLFKI